MSQEFTTIRSENSAVAMVIMASVVATATTLCLSSLKTWLQLGFDCETSLSELRHEPGSKLQLGKKLMCSCVSLESMDHILELFVSWHVV